MRCRKLYEYTDENNKLHKNVVWFGSGGIIEENEATLTFIEKNDITTKSDDIYCRVTGFFKYSETETTYEYRTKQDSNGKFAILYIDLQNKIVSYTTEDGEVIDFIIDTNKATNGFDYTNRYIYLIGFSKDNLIVNHQLTLDYDDDVVSENKVYLNSDIITVSENQIRFSDEIYSGYVEILNTRILPDPDLSLREQVRYSDDWTSNTWYAYNFSTGKYVLTLRKPGDWNANLNYYKFEQNINYSEKQRGVRDNITQRISVFKKELWYRPDYGLPIFDKIRNKGILDAITISMIASVPDVTNIGYYNSAISNHNYLLDFTVATTYTSDELLRLTLNQRN